MKWSHGESHTVQPTEIEPSETNFKIIQVDCFSDETVIDSDNEEDESDNVDHESDDEENEDCSQVPNVPVTSRKSSRQTRAPVYYAW